MVKKRNKEAAAVAALVNTHLMEAHRGVIPWGDDAIAIFGNDGYESVSGDNRAPREVELVREQLRRRGVAELGFGVSAAGYSWVLLVTAPAAEGQAGAAKKGAAYRFMEELTDLVWGAWLVACGGSSEERTSLNHVQRAIAAQVLFRGGWIGSDDGGPSRPTVRMTADSRVEIIIGGQRFVLPVKAAKELYKQVEAALAA